jgi:hypothetical protein
VTPGFFAWISIGQKTAKGRKENVPKGRDGLIIPAA